jgi:2-(S-pantetheinyl)-carbapenam-3-carboxylate methyltransferase
MNVYFNEYNIRMGAVSYLPLVSGLLRSYAETFPDIKDSYRFMPFVYAMDRPAAILAKYIEPPDVACFSSLMWNEQLNYRIAREVKARYPHCLVVFGGPNVPMPPQHSVEGWLVHHPYIDVAVRGEGEDAFVDILRAYKDGTPLSHIPGVAVNSGGMICFNSLERVFDRDMSYPSPYLDGVYDDVLAEGTANGHQFQAIIETNRGCPFPCTFCYWGRGGLSRRYRFKDLARVTAEIDWMGRHGIRYVFNADSNFGMHPRDHEIADAIVATKQTYGFPEKFRTCFGKNTDERIFQIGALLHAHGLEKGITLARQSNDTTTLDNIKRTNIKMATYVNLQSRFNDLNIPIYSEMILGLPGETAASWRRGVDELLEGGVKNQLFVYLCQVLTNTEMAEAAYRKKFGLQTKVIKLAEIHGEARPADFVDEYEEIIIGTNSMPHEDWKAALRFSYVMMLFHSLKLAYYVMILMLDRYGVKMSAFIEHVASRRFAGKPLLTRELDFYDEIIARMMERGEHRGTVLPEYGDIYWDVEEASFLRLTRDGMAFYDELVGLVYDFLYDAGIEYDAALVSQAVLYQEMRIPSQCQVAAGEVIFNWNLPEYFDRRFSSSPVPLVERVSSMTVTPVRWGGDLRRFARESILWGRKSGTMLTPVSYGQEAMAS